MKFLCKKTSWKKKQKWKIKSLVYEHSIWLTIVSYFWLKSFWINTCLLSLWVLVINWAKLLLENHQFFKWKKWWKNWPINSWEIQDCDG